MLTHSKDIHDLVTPISGTMKECFDYLTTHGPGGKGVVLLFSGGNAELGQPAQLFQTVRPWAAYDKTIAVAIHTTAIMDGVSMSALHVLMVTSLSQLAVLWEKETNLDIL
jgi:hypothetical protein